LFINLFDLLTTGCLVFGDGDETRFLGLVAFFLTGEGDLTAGGELLRFTGVVFFGLFLGLSLFGVVRFGL
jgi:hypothetical protein